MAELKTKLNEASVKDFLAGVSDDQKRQDAEQICTIMQEVTGEPPKMWGTSIVGFGSYHYKSKSGREGDWLMIGFSPRKANLTLYILDGYELKPHEQLLKKLGKHKRSKGCLYINHLSDVDLKVLRELITNSFKRVKSGKFLQ
jgi:hypothetical protein